MSAYDWYEAKAAGLGAEFLRGFYAHAAALHARVFRISKQEIYEELDRRSQQATIVYGRNSQNREICQLD